MQANNTRSHGIYRDVQMVILRLGTERERGRDAKGGRNRRRGTSTPRIRHMLLLPLLLPAFDNNYTPASRNPYKPPSTPHDYRRKLCCAGEASRESIRLANKLADHYTKLAKCDSVPFQLCCSVQLALGSNLRDDSNASLSKRSVTPVYVLFVELN